MCRIAVSFAEMSRCDDLVSVGWCLGKPGSVYAIYLRFGGEPTIQLDDATYQLIEQRLRAIATKTATAFDTQAAMMRQDRCPPA